MVDIINHYRNYWPDGVSLLFAFCKPVLKYGHKGIKMLLHASCAIDDIARPYGLETNKRHCHQPRFAPLLSGMDYITILCDLWNSN